MEVELRGPPGLYFNGWLTSLENDDVNKLGRINEIEHVEGTFDAKGLMVIEIMDIRNPSFTIVLSMKDAGERNEILAVNRRGQVIDDHLFEQIYDAVGVPSSTEVEALLFGENLGGVNLKFFGKQPTLIFRDSCNLEWYAIGRRQGVPHNVYDSSAVLLRENEFNAANVLLPTFGDTNPTRHEKPPPCIDVMSPILNEFRPNHPSHPDPSTMTIELRGTPGDKFEGFITSVENDVGNNLGRINDVAGAKGTFSDSGILTFSIMDIRNPSFTVVLSSKQPGMRNDRMLVDSNGHIAERELFGTIYDAIGVPHSEVDEGLLFAENLGGINLKHVRKQNLLVFRDSCSGEWYFVGHKPGEPDKVYDRTGSLLRDTEFNTPNILHPSFGNTNPTRRTSSSTLVMST